MKGSVKIVRSLPYLPGGFGVLPDGGLIVGDAWRRRIDRWALAGPEQMADLGKVAGFCLSDGIVDSHGGVPSVVAEDLFFPNGMVITQDNRTLIVAETLAHRLTAFGIKNDGSLQNRRVWAQFRDDVKPDGICLDCEGAIWIAATSPRALRVREGGDVDQQITTERPVFATMLGGPKRKHLFMCTSTSDDPVMTRRVSNATIDIAEVKTPGSGIP